MKSFELSSALEALQMEMEQLYGCLEKDIMEPDVDIIQPLSNAISKNRYYHNCQHIFGNFCRSA